MTIESLTKYFFFNISFSFVKQNLLSYLISLRSLIMDRYCSRKLPLVFYQSTIIVLYLTRYSYLLFVIITQLLNFVLWRTLEN